MRINGISVFAVLCFATAMAAFWGYTGRDDSHITYFVADALADGRGIVNFNGEPIEQSSSLSFTGLLALLVKVTGYPAAMLGPFVSFSILLLTVLMIGVVISNHAWGSLSAVVLLAAPSLYWALSGMENALYVALLFALTFLVAYNRPVAVALLAGLVTITRPEAPFVILTAFGILILRRHALWVLLVPSALGMVAAFGLRFFLELGLFPNTVGAKMNHGNLFEQVVIGAAYIAKTFMELPWTSLFLVGGIAWLVFRSRPLAKSERLISALTAFGAALFLFPLVAGGDWMESGRFLSAAYPILLLAILLGLGPRLRPGGIAILFIACVADFAALSRAPLGGSPIWAAPKYQVENYVLHPTEKYNRIHARDIGFLDRVIPAIDAAIPRDEDERLTVASIQAGMVPYYLWDKFSERVYFVDMLGLTTNHIHGCWDKMRSRIDPYPDLAAVEDCMGVSVDLIYDFVHNGRLEHIDAFGCEIVFIDHFKITDVTWREDFVGQQFLADCRNRG